MIGHKQVSPELETRDEPKRHMNFSYRVLEILLTEAASSKTFYEISELKDIKLLRLVFQPTMLLLLKWRLG